MRSSVMILAAGIAGIFASSGLLARTNTGLATGGPLASIDTQPAETAANSTIKPMGINRCDIRPEPGEE